MVTTTAGQMPGTGADDGGRLVAMALAAGRVALGTTALALPGVLVTVLFGRGDDEPGRRALRMFTRMLGVRDLALGAATLAALNHPRARRRLVWLGAAADAVDGLVTLRQPAIGRRTRRLVAAGALSVAAAGAWQASQTEPASG